VSAPVTGLRRIRHNLDLVTHLVRRDFLLSYRRSALGVFWSILLPMAQALVLVFVFQRIVPLNIESYPAFLLSALLPWAWFQTSVYASTGLFLNNRDLLRNPNMGAGLLVLVNALSNLVTYLCALPVLAVVLIWSGRPFAGTALLMFPVLLIFQALMILGLGLIVATLNVFYRDVEYLVSVALMLLFYLTPVFYRIDPSLPGYQIVAFFNPVAMLIQSYRDIFFDGTMPTAARLATTAVASFVVVGIGYAVYNKLSHDLVDVA